MGHSLPILGVPGVLGGGPKTLIVTTFTQTIGPDELLTNGNFSAWTGDNPDGWAVVGETGATLEVTERDPAQLHADTVSTGGAVNLYNSSSAAWLPAINQSALTVGNYYEARAEVTARASGTASIEDGLGKMVQTRASTGIICALGRATHAALYVRLASGQTTDLTYDWASAKQITLNEQQVAPSANMTLDAFYTLPASPASGTRLWLLARISDFSAGNYWVAELIYTGAQWNVTLFSVATHTRTSRITAANVGSTDGVRIVMNGDSVSLYTTANTGALWTQRGSTITNDTYLTATGINVLYSSDVTPVELICALP